MNRTTFVRKNLNTNNPNQTTSTASTTPNSGVIKKLPNGCKVSIQNGNLLTSSGLNDFDEIIGGGIPVGSILMIEEDINSSFYMFLLKYFLAEGVVQDHGVFFSSLIGLDPFEVLNKLPARLTKEEETEAEKLENQNNDNNNSKSKDGLDIAWRYQQYVEDARAKQQQAQVLGGLSSYCHTFDFTRKLNIQSFSPEHTHTLGFSATTQVSGDSPYRHLFLEIQNLVYKYNSESSLKPDQSRILRIGLQSFASPLWSNDEEGVIEFLHALKGLLRSSLSVCVITVPTYIYPQSFVKKISHLCDTVVSLNSFSGLGGETPEQFAEYLGLFNIKKIARLNTLSLNFHPDMLTYVFKMKRRAMCIEKIHLQPEFSRAGDSTTSNSSTASNTKAEKDSILSKMKSGSGLLCSTGGAGHNHSNKSSLDF